MLPWQQPFQEANVATPSSDEQCNIGRVLDSLQGKGWGRVKEEVSNLPLMRTQALHLCLIVHLPWDQGIII